VFESLKIWLSHTVQAAEVNRDAETVLLKGIASAPGIVLKTAVKGFLHNLETDMNEIANAPQVFVETVISPVKVLFNGIVNTGNAVKLRFSNAVAATKHAKNKIIEAFDEKLKLLNAIAKAPKVIFFMPKNLFNKALDKIVHSPLIAATDDVCNEIASETGTGMNAVVAGTMMMMESAANTLKKKAPMCVEKIRTPAARRIFRGVSTVLAWKLLSPASWFSKGISFIVPTRYIVLMAIGAGYLLSRKGAKKIGKDLLLQTIPDEEMLEENTPSEFGKRGNAAEARPLLPALSTCINYPIPRYDGLAIGGFIGLYMLLPSWINSIVLGIYAGGYQLAVHGTKSVLEHPARWLGGLWGMTSQSFVSKVLMCDILEKLSDQTHEQLGEEAARMVESDQYPVAQLWGGLGFMTLGVRLAEGDGFTYRSLTQIGAEALLYGYAMGLNEKIVKFKNPFEKSAKKKTEKPKGSVVETGLRKRKPREQLFKFSPLPPEKQTTFKKHKI